LIDSHSIGVGGVGVVLLDFDDISKEDVPSVELFSFLDVLFAVVSLELIEGVDFGGRTLEAVEVN
jgi:hypothetical protein